MCEGLVARDLQTREYLCYWLTGKNTYAKLPMPSYLCQEYLCYWLTGKKVGGRAHAVCVNEHEYISYLAAVHQLATTCCNCLPLSRVCKPVHFRRYCLTFSRQVVTPVAIMTSDAKGNHMRMLQLMESMDWFGRGKESFRLFRCGLERPQVLVCVCVCARSHLRKCACACACVCVHVRAVGCVGLGLQVRVWVRVRM